MDDFYSNEMNRRPINYTIACKAVKNGLPVFAVTDRRDYIASSIGTLYYHSLRSYILNYRIGSIPVLSVLFIFR